MPKINPDIPANSVQYFSNARGVNYFPSLESEWKKSGYLPRVDYVNAAALAIFAATDGLSVPPGNILEKAAALGYGALDIFTGSNGATIWKYYNEEDHEKSIIALKKLGVNCIRTPLNYAVWNRNKPLYISKVKSFLKVCDKHKIRVQFTLWDAEENLSTIYGQSIPEPTNYNALDLTYECSVEHPRNPYASKANDPTFFSGAGEFDAGVYLDQLASSVSAYQSMWCFDLCNKPVKEFYGLVTSSHDRLNQNLSSTPIKYTFSPKDGLSIFNDTSYLDNGKGTGPSGSFSIEDIKNLSGLVDFISVPFIANNDYAFKRYLNGAISGTQSYGISKPFMVYAAYDPELGQNFNTTVDVLNTSSVGYFGDIGVIDSPFSFGKSRAKGGNIYWDGQYADVSIASSLVSQASSINWYNRKDLSKYSRLKGKSDDPTNDSGGFFSGTPSFLEAYSSEYQTMPETRWNFLRDYYLNAGDTLINLMSRRKQGSKTFKAPYSSNYTDSVEYNLMTSSLHRNNLEENLRILYNFGDYFPAISSYTFSTGGDEWQVINKTMTIRNEFLKSLSKFIIDYDSNSVGYAELRNSVYDPNPIPHYEREELIDLISDIDDTYRYVKRNPTTNGITDFSSTRTYQYGDSIYGSADSGSHFSTYYDNFYSELCDQLKKCLMWIYREGETNSNFKIVSDSFLNEISFQSSSLSAVEVYSSEVTGSPEYTPGSLSSLKSPYFEVDVYDAESSSWLSSFVFQASGVGNPRQLDNSQRTGNFASLSSYWCPDGSHATMNFTTFGVSGLAKVRIRGKSDYANLAESTSLYVFPKRSNKTRSFTFNSEDNTFEGEVYIGDKLWLEFTDSNFAPSTPLFLFADPFKPPIPDGLQTYAGENRLDHLEIDPDAPNPQTVPNLTSNPSDAYTTINWASPGNPTVFSSLQPGTYFGPGIHYVSAGLPISSNSTYYIDANAYIIGGFDCASAHNSKVIGRGVFSPGELYPRSFIFNRDTQSGVKDLIEGAPAFYGPLGTSWSSMNEYSAEYRVTPGLPNMDVAGITIVNWGFFATGRNIIKSFNHMKALIPWSYNTDGFKPFNGLSGGRSSVKNSIMVCGDDQINAFSSVWNNEIIYRNLVVGSMRTSTFFNFVNTLNSDYWSVVRDIDVLSYAAPSGKPSPSKSSWSRNGLFQFYSSEETEAVGYARGTSNVVMEDIDVRGGGNHPLYHPIFRAGNMIRPGTAIYGGGDPPCGFYKNFNISNVNISPSAVTASSLDMSSTLVGLSGTILPGQNPVQETNRPEDWTITNLKINQNPPTFLTSDTVDDWVAWYEPLSGTNSVTDPDSVDGSSAGIVFKTT